MLKIYIISWKRGFLSSTFLHAVKLLKLNELNETLFHSWHVQVFIININLKWKLNNVKISNWSAGVDYRQRKVFSSNDDRYNGFAILDIVHMFKSHSNCFTMTFTCLSYLLWPIKIKIRTLWTHHVESQHEILGGKVLQSFWLESALRSEITTYDLLLFHTENFFASPIDLKTTQVS